MRLTKRRRRRVRRVGTRRDPHSREAIIRLGHQALEELDRNPHDQSASSYVFEDAFREIAPEKTYLADYIQNQRGYSGERLHIKHAIDYLEHQPDEERLQRVQKKVEKILSRAWKAKIIGPEDERTMPILIHLPQHIKRGFQIIDSTFRYFNKKASLREEIAEQGFRINPRSATTITRLARRVADTIYESGQK